MKNLLDILKWSEGYFEKSSLSKPRLEAERIISHVLKVDRISLYAEYDRPLTDDERLRIKKYILQVIKTKESFKTILEREEKEKKEEKNLEEEEDFRKEFIELLRKSIIYLKNTGSKEGKLEAEYIFSHVLDTPRMEMVLTYKDKISEKEKEEIKRMLIEVGKNKRPLQYVLGYEEFYGYRFNVREGVLIPRPETELLVEQCIELLKEEDEPRILELGIGSGAISISLGKEIKDSKILGVDISEAALEIALENKQLNEVKNVKFIRSDLFENVSYDKFNLIVSNPPYIPDYEYEKLDEKVKKYEPELALTTVDNGLFFYKKITREAKKYLRQGGYLAFEIGYNQGVAVKEILELNDFRNIQVLYDYAGLDRIVIGRL